tara:strand:- start:288 stop:431 length:144 start_codon:yes stop_codon:yes gene_type:complete
MKILKLALSIAILAVSATTFATGSRKTPPVPPTLFEEIIEIVTLKKK